VGTLRCADPDAVTPADVYHAPFLGLDAVGAPRAERIAALARAAAPQLDAVTLTAPLESEDDLRGAIAGADYVVSCLDASQANLAFKLNRVCLADGVRSISLALAGAEVIVGPAVLPGKSACYLCYRMRTVACAGSPEDAFAHERYLDRRKRDESERRESFVFGAGIAGHLVATEVANTLAGLVEPALTGRILTVKLTDLTVERHTVLRKPGCPACFPDG
jgi:adenylyltransferase/sulfurtransferase